MSRLRIMIVYLGICLALILCACAAFSQTRTSQSAVSVPRLIRLAGVVKDANGNVLHGNVGITFSLYKEQQGGAPLWVESQNLSLDAGGRYNVLLGASKPEGLPIEFFSSGDAQWLGVRVEGREEQARVLLVSVPYALKAQEAETLAGRSASQFVSSENLTDQVRREISAQVQSSGTSSSSTKSSSHSITAALGAGPTNFSGTTTDQVVGVTQLGTGVAISANAPSNNAIVGSTALATGIGVFGRVTNTGTGVSYGLRGDSSSASGRGVRGIALGASGVGVQATTRGTSGIGLLGESTATTGSNVAVVGNVVSSAGVAAIFNNLAGGKILSLRSKSIEITGVDGLGNIKTSGNLTMAGNLGLPVTKAAGTAGVITFGGNSFIHQFGTDNTFVGSLSGNFSMTGTDNTAVGMLTLSATNSGSFNVANGVGALAHNTDGFSNSAVGIDALFSNTHGTTNTAMGSSALASNTTGNNNTALGNQAGFTANHANANTVGNLNTFIGANSGPGTSAPLNNATAIGANALVNASNSLVLGDGTASVGIGTSAPAAFLHLVQPGQTASAPNALTVQGGASSGGLGGGITLQAGNSGINSMALGLGGGIVTITGGIGGSGNTPGAGGGLFLNGGTGASANNGGTGGAININGGSGGSGNSDVGGAGGNGGNIVLTPGSGGSGTPNGSSGSVIINGVLIKPAGSFKIDHPLDPANKYLSHSFVESPDMMNIYNGVVQLGRHGEAWVALPDYFEALNRDFRYQLTSIGRPAPRLYIAQEIRGNRFKIGGGKKGAKVSWQVTGIRHDAYADAHRITVEERKVGEERGTYLHPELFPRAEHEAATTSNLVKTSPQMRP